MIAPPRLAELALASYAAPPSFANDKIRAVLTEEAGIAIVAFAGTDPTRLGDWLRDIQAWPSRADPDLGPVHAGFLGDVAGIALDLMGALAGRRFALTGHSKGGAEAQLFAAMLAVVGLPPAMLVTFGAPKVAGPGNTLLAPLLAARPGQEDAGADYRHRDDVVPQLPAGFAHPRPVTQLVPPRLALNVIADHFMASYLAALQAASMAPTLAN